MTCRLPRPDPQALFNRYRQLFSSTVLGGGNVIPESNEWYAVAVNYAIAEEFYAIAEQAYKSRDPREACCEDLVNIAAQDGVYPFPATYAQGFVKLTGTAGTAIPSPLEFVISGVTFVTASSISQPREIQDDGTATVRVRSLSSGAASNVTATTGTMSQRITGVEQTVTVCGGTFCDGTDAENCEVFRARYLRRMQYNPRATNQWIIDKMLEWPCATRALQRGGSCCVCTDCGNGGTDCPNCSCSDCGGQLAFYVMFDNSFPCGIAPLSVIEEVQTWLFGSPQGYGLGQVEIGVCGRIHHVTGFTVNVNIDIVGCLTGGQSDLIRSLIIEYFTTLVPSQPLKTVAISAILTSVIGGEVDFDVDLILNDPVADNDKIELGTCHIEPKCDFLPCLGSINITNAGSGTGNCT